MMSEKGNAETWQEKQDKVCTGRLIRGNIISCFSESLSCASQPGAVDGQDQSGKNTGHYRDFGLARCCLACEVVAKTLHIDQGRGFTILLFFCTETTTTFKIVSFAVAAVVYSGVIFPALLSRKLQTGVGNDGILEYSGVVDLPEHQ